ncbi:MAG: hypothetical protein KF729_15820 [Sandaracinaceae bacterium]|nr:hypothetical protein [Sandaracinaceae bacterium]
MFETERLPPAVRPAVERALRDGEGHEAAIRALEAHLDDGGERSPEVLLALATLTYEDAATVVLSRLAQASRTALALVEEARAAAPERSEAVERLHATFAAALEHEQAREQRLRRLLADRRGARPAELMELAHRILMSGEDDQLAAELMAAAADG